ncbi:DUF3006 family protein [Oceanobacillus sp. FSL H7-0719]|uniref:DUF3006 family protein n=1 Tax=Oceanobacillus sp. FSL H7-0719 TaxID=2954507 RepID=UPI00324C6816
MCTMKGILDRFEGEKAVILIEEEHEEIIIDKNELPANSKVNTIFKVSKRNGSYQIDSIDTTAEKQASQKSSALMAKLRAKSSGSKFKR